MKYLEEVINYTKKFAAKYGIFFIFLIFLSTTFVSFYGKSYDNQDFDYLRISGRSIKEIIFKNYGDQLPLWFLIVKAYTFIFGKSEIALRIFSITIFLLSAFILSKLCEIYKLNKYLICALYLFNPLLLIDTAYNFKHWSFLILIVLLTIYCFEKFKTTNQKKYFIFLIIAIISGIYSNLVFLVFLYPLIIYFLINVILKQIKLKVFILFLIILLILVLPLFYYYQKAENQLINVLGKNMDWGTEARGFDFMKESLSVISGVRYLKNHNILSKILVLLILSFVVFQFFQKKDKILAYTKLWLILTVFFILIILMAVASYTPVQFRYFNLAIPLFYLAIFPKSKKFYIALLGIVLLSLTVFSSIQAAKDFNPADWKSVTSFLKTRIKDDTQLLLLYKFSIGPFIMDYYLQKPVERLQNFDDPSILSANDIWIIRVHGDYNKVYGLYSKYNIEEYNDFLPFLLIHLTKRKAPINTNYLIFNNPLVEIVIKGKKENFQFSNGTISSDCCKEDWQRIRIDKITSEGVDKICLFAHPRNNAKINLTYKNIKLKKTIRFNTGISDDMVTGEHSPVYMDIYIDNVFLKRIIQPDKRGWHTTDVDTSKYENKSAEIKLTISSDNDGKRHFCFTAQIIDKKSENDYFYRNLENAKAMVENKSCKIYKTDSIWPHNEKNPPFLDSKIFERWDCEENLISKNRIWNTIGKSYAVSNNEFKEAIWMHPMTNKVKSLKYQNIDLYVGKIKGFYGLNDYAMANEIKATLTFTVMANGEKVYEDKFNPTKGWKNFEIPFNPVRNSAEIQTNQFNNNKISNGVNKKLDNIIFSITTSNDRWNHFFFNAFLEE